MANEHGHESGVTSRASIKGHPIHPMVVPLPIGFLIGVLGADIGYWWTGDPFWARAALWLVGAGFITGLLAAVFGLTDFISLQRVRQHSEGWIHLVGNAIALLVVLGNFLLRTGAPAEAVLPTGIILSLVTVCILMVTSWYGGELSYRHKIGVMEPPAAPAPQQPQAQPVETKRRSSRAG